MCTFHILRDVIFVRSDIYQLKSAVGKNVFSYCKTDPTPVSLDTENYSSTSYLVILNEELIVVEKIGNKIMHSEPPENIICGIDECEYGIHF